MILKSNIYKDVFLLDSVDDNEHGLENVVITSSIPSVLTWGFDDIFRIFSIEEDNKHTILPTLGLLYVYIDYTCPTISHPRDIMAIDAATYTKLILLFPQHGDFLRERLGKRMKILSGL